MKCGREGGQPALFLPGAGWTCTEGLSLARMLPQFPWYLVDLPGTGGSAPLALATAAGFAAWLRAFCERLGIERPHLAGHSLGGYLALAAAARRLPLRSLLLIDGGVAPLIVPQSLGAIAYAVPLISLLDRLTGGALVAKRPGRPGAAEPPEAPEALARRFGLPMTEDLCVAVEDAPKPGEPWELDAAAQQRLGLIGARLRWRRAISAVEAPVFAVIAQHPAGPEWARRRAARSARLLRGMPGVSVAESPTGHYPFWEDPNGLRPRCGAFRWRNPG